MIAKAFIPVDDNISKDEFRTALRRVKDDKIHYLGTLSDKNIGDSYQVRKSNITIYEHGPSAFIVIGEDESDVSDSVNYLEEKLNEVFEERSET
jgi:hypothetical protein